MKKALLIILDGFGIRPESDRNAVSAAHAPTLKKLISDSPQTRLACCGLDVGLPEGQMGNSEVGHLNIGAGRIVFQDITRIDLAIRNGELDTNRVWRDILKSGQQPGHTLHLMGLVSDGGVHSSDQHLTGMLQRLADANIRNVVVHAFTDGRDTPPKSGSRFVQQIDEFAKSIGLPGVVSIIGRYYAMDRDQRWERTKLAYDALVHGKALAFSSVTEAMEATYNRGVNDEFIDPTIIGEVTQNRIQPGDTVLFFNFRADRARQLSRALAIDSFAEFPVEKLSLHYFTLTSYDAKFPFPVLFEPISMSGLLGEVVSQAGLKQLRSAETEKYAHVTYFFNGGGETPFEGEDRILIQSPKIATYDLQPEMSSVGVTDAVQQAIESDTYSLIVVNFANCDMVGHTGSLEAATHAVEAVDRGVERLLASALQHGYISFVTADHGNAEQMWDYVENCPHTQHTLNDVYFIGVSNEPLPKFRSRGRLADIAPTLLQILDLPVPSEMTGQTLFESV